MDPPPSQGVLYSSVSGLSSQEENRLRDRDEEHPRLKTAATFWGDGIRVRGQLLCSVVQGRDSERLSWEENEIFEVEIVSLRLSL